MKEFLICVLLVVAVREFHSAEVTCGKKENCWISDSLLHGNNDDNRVDREKSEIATFLNLSFFA